MRSSQWCADLSGAILKVFKWSPNAPEEWFGRGGPSEETTMSPLIFHLLVGFAFMTVWAIGIPLVARFIPSAEDPQAFLAPAIPSMVLTCLFAGGFVNFFVSLNEATGEKVLGLLVLMVVGVTLTCRLAWVVISRRAVALPVAA